MSLSRSLHLSLSLSPFNSVNNLVLGHPRSVLLMKKKYCLWKAFLFILHMPPRSSLSFCLDEGVLVINGSCPPSFPLLALHPFQLKQRRIPIAVLALLRRAAGSTSSRSLCFASSVLWWGGGWRPSRRQRWWLRRTTGSAGQVWERNRDGRERGRRFQYRRREE